jgi:Holliday junction resolvase-like predicted endonuclease
MEVDFQIQLAKGNRAEDKIRTYFESSGCSVEKVDYKTCPYDLLVTDKKGNQFRVEVKNWGYKDWKTMFIETVQIAAQSRRETIPEYLSHYNEIEYICWFNRLTGVAYFYDCETFSKYILANKDNERFNNFKPTTAKGLLVDCECAGLGLVFKKELGI